jgi:hypothetical protein
MMMNAIMTACSLSAVTAFKNLAKSVMMATLTLMTPALTLVRSQCVEIESPVLISLRVKRVMSNVMMGMM